MAKPKLIIFASGGKVGGGSGFENLVKARELGILDAEIMAVVSNRDSGGVREKAIKHKIPFIYFGEPWTSECYKEIALGADFVALSGWLKLVSGLDPRTTFNIHPGPLPRFGGAGMYGHHVHEAVLEAYKRGELTHSEVSMHFVTPVYDEGPKFFSCPVPILPEDTCESLGKRVNEAEHLHQPIITNQVIHGRIRWDGKNPNSLVIE